MDDVVDDVVVGVVIETVVVLVAVVVRSQAAIPKHSNNAAQIQVLRILSSCIPLKSQRVDIYLSLSVYHRSLTEGREITSFPMKTTFILP